MQACCQRNNSRLYCQRLRVTRSSPWMVVVPLDPVAKEPHHSRYQRNRVAVVFGSARFTALRQQRPGGAIQHLSAEHLEIATGSRPLATSHRGGMGVRGEGRDPGLPAADPDRRALAVPASAGLGQSIRSRPRGRRISYLVSLAAREPDQLRGYRCHRSEMGIGYNKPLASVVLGDGHMHCIRCLQSVAHG